MSGSLGRRCSGSWGVRAMRSAKASSTPRAVAGEHGGQGVERAVVVPGHLGRDHLARRAEEREQPGAGGLRPDEREVDRACGRRGRCTTRCRPAASSTCIGMARHMAQGSLAARIARIAHPRCGRHRPRWGGRFRSGRGRGSDRRADRGPRPRAARRERPSRPASRGRCESPPGSFARTTSVRLPPKSMRTSGCTPTSTARSGAWPESCASESTSWKLDWCRLILPMPR